MQKFNNILRFIVYSILGFFWVACGDDEGIEIVTDKEETRVVVNDEDYNLCEELVSDKGDVNGYEYVDLGLPSGNLWASCNLGANHIDELGDLYSWGELSTKYSYSRESYDYYKKEEDFKGNEIWGYTKYVPEANKRYGFSNFSDDLTVLDLEDDVAHKKMGGSWRMPTSCDIQELIDNCTRAWYVTHVSTADEWSLADFFESCAHTECPYERVAGYVMFGPNGNWIFFPAAGHNYGNARDGNLSYGGYWSRSLRPSDPCDAFYLNFSLYGMALSYGYRSNGYSIRAVCPANKE